MSVVADLPASAKELYKPHPGFNADMTQSDATMSWFVPDADLLTFLQAVGGRPETIGGVGGSITRVVPLQHPVYTWMYAKSVRGVGIGWDGQPEEGDPARVHQVDVTFGTLPWPTDGTEAYLSRSTQPSVRVMDLPRNGVLVGGAIPSNDRCTTVEGFDMAITIHQMPYANEAAWYLRSGSVNSDVFFGVAAGFVKYIGPSMSNSVTFGGTRTYEITHNFAFSRLKWNQEYDETGALVDLSVGGSPRYPSLNFWAAFFT